jgi:alpha-tubulin suppressor-like RCC1 family protein
VAGLEQVRYEALAGSRADAFACAVAADRTAWCWGSAYLGRLGDGGIEQLQRVPVQVTTAAATPLSGVLHVSLGDAHACAAVEGGDGTAWCWGSDRYETLGNGPVDGQLARAAAVLRDATTTLTHVASVEVGTYHGCALLDSGQVWCWGLGESGRLGNPDTARQPYATQVVLDSGQPLDDATLLAVGAAHACVLRQDQGVWCWGANDSGQLGDGGNTSRHAPVQVLGAPGLVSALSLGGAHSCARTQEGQAWCWGANTFGQLGDGSAVSSSVPVRVQQAAGQALQAVVALSAGLAFTCAVDGAGATLCWGANSDGQLGQPRSTPLAMLPLVVAVGCR